MLVRIGIILRELPLFSRHLDSFNYLNTAIFILLPISQQYQKSYHMYRILLLALVSLHSLAWEFQRQQLFPQESDHLKQDLFYFDQIIDHYNYQASSTWKQRYYVFDDYFNPSKGPIILYISGEAECRGISDLSWVAKMAQETQGMVISVEHRFYGKSLPFGVNSLNTANLKYLSSEQALRDLGYFLESIKASGLHRITKQNPWVVIGGSYAGAMSAWFRNKYPHLTVGAISSSGVVLAVEEFDMFDEQIYISTHKSGSFCDQAIVDITNYVEGQVTGPNKDAFRAEFNAEKLTAREFLFYFSDVIVFQVQYGSRVSFCEKLKNKTLEEQFNIVKDMVLKVTPVDYGAYYLSNATFALNDGRGGRSWIYQSCTEFSYFQTFSKQHPMRSKMLTIDFYRQWCENIFGPGVWPYVSRVNTQFGGLNLNTNNLIMTNGVEDPWQWAGVRKSPSSSIYAKIIDCDTCAHCCDLHAPSKNDAKDLVDTRAYELARVKEWISQHYELLQK